ncbi:MAG: ATP-binding protein [Bacilli bacterium]|jgi:predicted AAA+ superfamily ATPase|nr:ATP-binding protein [Bacilli bacterium]
MKIIARENYLKQLISVKDTSEIKIITGIRRSGKSQLMLSYIEHLKNNATDINIIYIDFNDIANEKLKKYHALNEYIEAKFVNGKNNFLFIDEVQMCDKFELVINSLHSKHKYDIYLTGSNAFLLSSDLSTLFTGRYIQIHIFPFSFKEYLAYFEKKEDFDKLFDDYVIKGGMPGSYLYSDEKNRVNYLKDVYETIIKRDLVERYNLENKFLFDHICDFLMDNVSNLTSPNKISNILLQDKITTNHVTVNNYIKYLCDAFLFYDIKRYDIKGKMYLATNDKFYLCDTSFRYALLGLKNLDFGRMYENIVCIELLRRGYEVHVGKLYSTEIDFVATKGSRQIYIQVSSYIQNEDTFKREYEPLLKIKDAYPKIIIARTRMPQYTYEGIKIFDITRWLMEDMGD